MEQAAFLVVHLLIPVLVSVFTIKTDPRSRGSYAIKACFCLSIIWFLFLWGQYALTGSYYFRYALLIIPVVILATFKSKIKRTMRVWPAELMSRFLIGLLAMITLVITIQCIRMVRGNSYPSEAISLQFPLKDGTYYISSGGTIKLLNGHIRELPTAQQYALDINKLNTFGAASSALFAGKNGDHFIFSETVYSPCSGTVIQTKTNVKDNAFASFAVDPAQGKGNFITLECKGVYISLFHLKENSIVVEAGDRVDTGQPVGQVGNSGFSQEPHLHIQAAMLRSDSSFVGIPMRFNERILSRNNIVVN